MKGSLTSREDTAKASKGLGGKSKGGYIKIDDGDNLIRILPIDFIGEHVHPIRISKTEFVMAVCLGGMDGGGYAPDKCPICKKAKKHWDKIKKIKGSDSFEKSKKLKVEAQLEKEEGKKLQTKPYTIIVGVKGEIQKKSGKNVKLFNKRIRGIIQTKTVFRFISIFSLLFKSNNPINMNA